MLCKILSSIKNYTENQNSYPQLLIQANEAFMIQMWIELKNKGDCKVYMCKLSKFWAEPI